MQPKSGPREEATLTDQTGEGTRTGIIAGATIEDFNPIFNNSELCFFELLFINPDALISTYPEPAITRGRSN